MSGYSHPLNTKVDANQVLTRAYDEVNNRLRVDAQVTASIGTVDVIIDAASGDNIAISDGSNTLAVNADGSINIQATNFDIRDLIYTQDSVSSYVKAGTDGDPIGSLNYGGLEWLQTASNLVDASGTPLNVVGGDLGVIIGGGNISLVAQADEDSEFEDGNAGIYVLTVRQDTLAVSTSDDGDYSSFKSNQLGELYVHDSDTITELSNIKIDTALLASCVVGSTLNIRDLSASQDSVSIADGSNVLNINLDGSINANVISSSLPAGAATEATLSSILTELTQKTEPSDVQNTRLLSEATDSVAVPLAEALLTNIDGKLPASLGQKPMAGSLSVTIATDQPIKPISGTENGQVSGTQYTFVNNLRQQILAAKDRIQNLTYSDFGTKNERITQIDYTAPSIGSGAGYTARKSLTYSLVSGKYRRDTISWSLI